MKIPLLILLMSRICELWADVKHDFLDFGENFPRLNSGSTILISNRYMCKRKGFTLIELLVVIATIALLMAILMPSLNRVKKQAKSVSCQGQLKKWSLIFAMYTNDNEGYFHDRPASKH